jgi:excisionase family DNA binding protein
LATLRDRWRRMEADLDEKCGRKQNYTVSEAAAFWGVCQETAYRWHRKGEISSTNYGERKIRISRQQMLDKQWERYGEPAFFSKLFSGLPERH